MEMNSSPTKQFNKRADELEIVKFTLSDIPEGRELLLSLLVKDEKFCNLLKNRYGITNNKFIGEGGFSLVYGCTYESIKSGTESAITNGAVKFASYRCLTGVGEEEERFADIDMDKDLRAEVMSYFFRESYAYALLDYERQKGLAEPFIIAVYCTDEKTGDEEIYDYVFGVNMPLYKKLDDVIPGECDEQMVLRIAYDVLQQLSIVHNDGVRHRDIKLENIMYDEEKGKYVLIDWGSSCRTTDQVTGKYIYAKKAIEAYTPVYVDPLRFDKDERNANSVATDLYSLGAFIAYMIHPKGYNAGQTIDQFHKVAGSSITVDGKKICTMNAPEIYNILTKQEGKDTADENYCSEIRRNTSWIVSKAMNHYTGYANTGEMMAAVKGLLGVKEPVIEEKKEKEPPKRKNSKMLLPSYLGCVPAVFAILYTLADSGLAGMNSHIAGNDNVILSLLCLLLILLPFIKRNFTKSSKKLLVDKSIFTETVIFVLLTFFWMGFLVSQKLKSLDIPYPLCFNCIHLIIAGITSRVSEKQFGSIGRIVGCLIAGLVSGYSVVACIGAKLSESWDIVTPMGIAGLLWGLIFTYCAFSYKTRLIRKR